MTDSASPRAFARGAQGLTGIGVCAAISAIGLAAYALAVVRHVAGVEAVYTDVKVVSVIAIIVGVASIIGFGLVLWQPSRNSVLTTGALLAMCGVPAILMFARSVSEHRAILVLLDIRGAAVSAIIAGVCAIVGSASVAGTAAVAIRSEATRGASRRPFIVPVLSGVLTLVVVGTVTGALIGDAAVRARLEPSMEATARPIPDDATGIDDVAFRLRLPTARHSIAAAGPGFVIDDEEAVIAHDGETGRPRWRFDYAAIGGKPAESGASMHIFEQPEGDIVVVRGELITVGLDAMTGSVLWRSADPSLQSPIQRLRAFEDQRTQITETGPDPSDLVRFEPDTGVVTRQHLDCTPLIGSSNRFTVRWECGRPGRFEIVDSDFQDVRHVDVEPPTNHQLYAINSLGGEFFAFVTKGNDGPLNVIVIDASVGRAIDSFTTSTFDPTTVHDGVLAWPHFSDDRRSGFRNPTSTLRLRNVHTHRSVDVDLGESSIHDAGFSDVSDYEYAWVGDRLAIGVSSQLVILEPKNRSVSTRLEPCIEGSSIYKAYIGRLVLAPGSLVVACSAPKNLPYDAEAVGLR